MKLFLTGMDETNERLVWDLLLHTATNYSAQYLYLAPKFPRKLRYNEDMTVVFVHNGMNKINNKNSSKANKKKNVTDGYIKAVKKAKVAAR